MRRILSVLVPSIGAITIAQPAYAACTTGSTAQKLDCLATQLTAAQSKIASLQADLDAADLRIAELEAADFATRAEVDDEISAVEAWASGEDDALWSWVTNLAGLPSAVIEGSDVYDGVDYVTTSTSATFYLAENSPIWWGSVSFECSLDWPGAGAMTWTPCGSTLDYKDGAHTDATFEDLAVGSHSLWVRAIDTRGVQREITSYGVYYWTIEAAAP